MPSSTTPADSGSKRTPKPRAKRAKPVKGDVEPAVEQPTGSDLVLRDPTDRQELLAVIDRHDEAMIVEELQRRTLKVMLYSFSQGGQEVTDLSYLGVNEAVRVMNASRKWRITVDPASLVVIEKRLDLGAGAEDVYDATIYARDLTNDYGQFGTYVQPMRMKLKDASAIARAKSKGQHVDDDGRVADKFAKQKAINKAQRNGLRIHIPEAIRQTLIAQYRGDPQAIRRIEVGAGAAEIAKLPPPLTDEKAEQQKDQARELYQALREVNPLALFPAQFHAYLARAEHDHATLDDYLGYLRDRIEKEKKAADEAKGGAA